MDENVLFQYDAGLTIDQICDSLNISEKEIIRILLKYKRIRKIAHV